MNLKENWSFFEINNNHIYNLVDNNNLKGGLEW